jgi:AICAR transformylase/IMP cyclohydrolase PurH
MADLARDLLALGVEVYATDGTREHLAADGIDVLPVSDLTNVPPLVGGMVKTSTAVRRHPRPSRLAEQSPLADRGYRPAP